MTSKAVALFLTSYSIQATSEEVLRGNQSHRKHQMGTTHVAPRLREIRIEAQPDRHRGTPQIPYTIKRNNDVDLGQ
jgi:hypothetical protein